MSFIQDLNPASFSPEDGSSGPDPDYFYLYWRMWDFAYVKVKSEASAVSPLVSVIAVIELRWAMLGPLLKAEAKFTLVDCSTTTQAAIWW